MQCSLYYIQLKKNTDNNADKSKTKQKLFLIRALIQRPPRRWRVVGRQHGLDSSPLAAD